ncbi:hypothetical protein [Streptomyces sp. NPDC020951]|uniref:hypothetical protein n=1 Tax=Streptomyces sp. NPDC020951 TaxID=3365104 RepID=UPI0037A0FC53
MIWLLLAVAVLLAVVVVLAVDDARWCRRALPPVRQRAPRAPGPGAVSGPWDPEFSLNRGRRVRRSRAYARSRYPTGDTAYAPGRPPAIEPPPTETPAVAQRRTAA